MQGSAGEGEQNAASVIASEARQSPTRDVEIVSSQKTLPAMTDGNAVAREERAVLRQIADADIANMTPLQALNLLNERQIRIKQSNSRAVE